MLSLVNISHKNYSLMVFLMFLPWNMVSFRCQVSLSELQTFVGYLGGVQKFFEQRRKRVTQSRKDVRSPSCGWWATHHWGWASHLGWPMVTKKVVEYGWIDFFLCTNWKVRILFLCEMGYNVGDLSNASHATILEVRFFSLFFSIIPNGGSNNRNKALLEYRKSYGL